MKIGNKVRIHDGSYAMVKDGRGKLTSISGTVLIAEGVFEVIEISKYPFQTDNSSFCITEKKQVNDLKLRSIKDPERIVYTQSRFTSNC